ncbi:MAG: ATP-binding protein [Rikenellaceae bacterium]
MKITEKQAIVQQLREYCELKGSQNKAAATIKGVSSATLSQVLNEKWELITDEMWRNIASQIGYDARKWVVVETEGYSIMSTVLKDAQNNSETFAIVGNAGCGKTQAIDVYARRNKNVYVLSCTGFWTLKYMLQRILKTMGVEYRGCTIIELAEEVEYQLKRNGKSVLIFDEADKLKEGPFNYLITLYNTLNHHCGVVLCATRHLEKRINRGASRNKEGYEEIKSRMGGKCIQLPIVSVEDIYSVCLANGVCDESVIDNIVDDSGNDIRRVRRLIHAHKQSLIAI